MSHFFCLLCNDFDSQIPEALPVDISTVQTKLPESDLSVWATEVRVGRDGVLDLFRVSLN
jgi:hypothetical protein